MTEQSSYRARSFANVLDDIARRETPDMRWLRLASERLAKMRADETHPHIGDKR